MSLERWPSPLALASGPLSTNSELDTPKLLTQSQGSNKGKPEGALAPSEAIIPLHAKNTSPIIWI